MIFAMYLFALMTGVTCERLGTDTLYTLNALLALGVLGDA